MSKRASDPLKYRTPVRDLTGQRFGKLVVLRPGGYASKQRWWHCRCDCGTELIRPMQSLLNGRDRGYVSACEKCNPQCCTKAKPEPVRATKRQRCEHGFVDPHKLCTVCMAANRRTA